MRRPHSRSNSQTEMMSCYVAYNLLFECHCRQQAHAWVFIKVMYWRYVESYVLLCVTKMTFLRVFEMRETRPPEIELGHPPLSGTVPQFRRKVAVFYLVLV
jgi:hypothetical protein